MTFASSVALLSCGIAVYVAALSWQLSRAPGWQDLRYFALAAVTGGLYAALNIPTSAPIASDATVVWCSRVQLAAAALHSIAWLRYSTILLGRPRSRLDAAVVPVLWGVAAVSVLTPAFLPGGLRVHTFAPLGITYRTADASITGTIAYAIALATLCVPVGRFAAAWKRRVPNAGVQLAALVVLLAMGLNDTLVVEGAYSAPYLLDLGFLLPAAAVGYALTARFVEDARAHQALRAELERQVDERTAELGRTQGALHRAEKLAALGQFAAGVAHEVNNPAAVVTANLHFLAETERDHLGDSAQDAVSESLVAMQRIGAIVRQLLEAGRLAASPEARTSVAPKPLADAAISAARARFGKRVLVMNLVPERLWALAQEGVLAQVLVNLVVNSVQAIPDRRSDGRVLIRAEEDGDRVRIVVEDNGSGIPPDVLRRVFEPFFTTKPFGSGTGLGLAVSRGLVIGLGGDLRLESEPGAGTRAIVELAAAPPAGAPPRARRSRSSRRASTYSSWTTRRRCSRRCGASSSRATASTSRRAWTRGSSGSGRAPIDLVLCDVMMPAGGGERLYRTLLGHAPAIARRVVFFTGGAVTESARQFLRNQPQPILTKPLDLGQLARAAEQVASATDGGR